MRFGKKTASRSAAFDDRSGEADRFRLATPWSLPTEPNLWHDAQLASNAFRPASTSSDLLRLIDGFLEHLLTADYPTGGSCRERCRRAGAAPATATATPSTASGRGCRRLARLDIGELRWRERREVRCLLVEQRLLVIGRVESETESKNWPTKLMNCAPPRHFEARPSTSASCVLSAGGPALLDHPQRIKVVELQLLIVVVLGIAARIFGDGRRLARVAEHQRELAIDALVLRRKLVDDERVQLLRSAGGRPSLTSVVVYMNVR